MVSTVQSSIHRWKIEKKNDAKFSVSNNSVHLDLVEFCSDYTGGYTGIKLPGLIKTRSITHHAMGKIWLSRLFVAGNHRALQVPVLRGER